MARGAHKVVRSVAAVLAALAIAGGSVAVAPSGAAPIRANDGAVSTAAPRVAIVLFDGTGTEQWQTLAGESIRWPIVDGELEVSPGRGDVRTARTFGDFRLHLELWLPTSADGAAEQDRGNSGVYLQERYEIQVLDSFGQVVSGRDDAAAVYGIKDADVNAALPAEAWQAYDVLFRAARWSDGVKVENARLTLAWNGVVVHDDVEIPSPTAGGRPESAEPGPLLLQDHAHRVRYRNIWIEPLDDVGGS